MEAEVARLSKELGKVSGEIKKLSGKLSNEQFLSKAPEDVIVEQKRRLAEETETKDQLRSCASANERAWVKLKDFIFKFHLI